MVYVIATLILVVSFRTIFLRFIFVNIENICFMLTYFYTHIHKYTESYSFKDRAIVYVLTIECCVALVITDQRLLRQSIFNHTLLLHR